MALAITIFLAFNLALAFFSPDFGDWSVYIRPVRGQPRLPVEGAWEAGGPTPAADLDITAGAQPMLAVANRFSLRPGGMQMSATIALVAAGPILSFGSNYPRQMPATFGLAWFPQRLAGK